MNKLARLVFLWYIFLTLFAILGSTKLGVLDLAGGIAIMWFLYLFFISGFVVCTNNSKYCLKKKLTNFKLFSNSLDVLAGVALVASLYSSFFYTGASVYDIYLNIFAGESLYNRYQEYFAQNNIAEFTIEKIPAILSMVLMKFILLLSSYIIFIRQESVRRADKFYYFVIVLSYLFFSVARGTSFELFEIFVLIVFCRAFKQYYFGTNHLRKSPCANLFLVLMVFFALLAYKYNIEARYGFSYNEAGPTRELVIDRSSLIYTFSPSIAELSVKLSGYFTFGLFFTATFIYDLWLTSWPNFLIYLMPLPNLTTEPIRGAVCDVHIDCGAAWVPDTINILQYMGFMGLLIFVLILGIFFRFTLRSLIFDLSFEKITILFFIFLSMISLPIGNFVLVSSANIVLILFSIAKLSCKGLLRRVIIVR